MTIKSTIQKAERLTGEKVIPVTPRNKHEGVKDGDAFNLLYKGHTLTFIAFKLYEREPVAHIFTTKREGTATEFHDNITQALKHINAVTRGEQPNYFAD